MKINSLNSGNLGLIKQNATQNYKSLSSTEPNGSESCDTCQLSFNAGKRSIINEKHSANLFKRLLFLLGIGSYVYGKKGEGSDLQSTESVNCDNELPNNIEDVDLNLESEVKGEDGSVKKYNKDGDLYEEITSDGILKKYRTDLNGELYFEQFPDGSSKEYCLWVGSYISVIETTADGTKNYYNRGGILDSRSLPDGKRESFYESGALYVEELPDGTYNEYYESGVLKYHLYKEPKDGIVYESFYEDGSICERGLSDGKTEKYSQDGVLLEYYDDGVTLKSETFPDGSSKQYYENGSLKSEWTSDGLYRSYHMTGEIDTLTFSDGTSKSYYKGGELASESFTDGTSKCYYETGELSTEWAADKSVKRYYKSGDLKYETFIDGSCKSYYQSGKLKSEKFPDGTYRSYYEDGSLHREITADGTYNVYTPDGKLFGSTKSVFNTAGVSHYIYDED